ncbi:MAG: hypothetical protein GY723_14050 [bacterium]|nr:hypothetical protein [bacterium]MCP5065362.1 hypothetical protein [bacterium]
MRCLLFAGWIGLALAVSALADDDLGRWEPTRQEQGITISRLTGGSAQPTFRGTVVMAAELMQVLAVLSDDSRRVEWLARCIESRRLDERPDGSLLFYTRTKGRWPVSDRDSVTESKVTISPARDRAVIELQAAESPLMPPVRGAVRMPVMRGHYLLEAVSPGRTRVEYQLSMQLGGSVPEFVSAFVEEELPFETLQALRDQVDETRGQYALEIEAFRHRLPSVAAPPSEDPGI